MTEKQTDSEIQAVDLTEPECFRWARAPNNISFGADIVEALIQIDDDHTLILYAEASAAHLVVPALRKALTPEKVFATLEKA